jgi:hypothetical protein
MEYSTILFRFFNLFILIAAFIYLFKAKFLSVIYNTIQNKLHYLRSLHKKRQEVIQQQENLDITIAQEHALMERLRSNVLQWYTIWQQQDDTDKKRQIQIDRKIQEITREQRHNRTNQIIQELVAPKALKSAHKELKEIFSHSVQQKKYLKSLFDVIVQ